MTLNIYFKEKIHRLPMYKYLPLIFAALLMLITGTLTLARQADPPEWLYFRWEGNTPGAGYQVRLYRYEWGKETVSIAASGVLPGNLRPGPDAFTLTGSALYPGNQLRQVFIIDRRGFRWVTRLNTGYTSAPDFSPDGRWLVASYAHFNNQTDIYRIRTDGSERTALTDDSPLDLSPRWSPDGQWILFTSRREDGRSELYLMRPDGSSLRRLTFNEYPELYSQWSADSYWIYFVLDHGGSESIYRIRPDGLGYETLAVNLATINALAIAPDGRWLYYAEERDHRLTLYRLRPASSAPQILLEAPGLAMDFALSPDGQQIAFTIKGNSTLPHLYTMDNDGQNVQPLITLPGEKSAPIWQALPQKSWRPVLLFTAALFSFLVFVYRHFIQH